MTLGNEKSLTEGGQLPAHRLGQARNLQGGQGLAGGQSGILEAFLHAALLAFEQLHLDYMMEIASKAPALAFRPDRDVLCMAHHGSQA